MKDAFILVSILFGFAGGAIGLWTALAVTVEDNAENFIATLQRQGRLAAVAGACAAISSVLLAIQYFLSIQ